MAVFPIKPRLLSITIQTAGAIAALAWTIKLVENGLIFRGFSICVASALCYPAYVFPILQNQYRNFICFCRKRGWNGAAILWFFLGLASFLTVFLALSEPAHAMFFGDAEKWLKDNLKPNGQTNTALNNMISFVFNILRLSFLIYIGVAVVQIIQKGREQEDWISLARTPAIVVGAVIIGDAMATMVVGDGNGG